MLSVETENRLSKLLLTLADGEASVEVSRQVLGNQLGFDPYQVFKLLDSENKGYIDSFNLVDFYRRHSLFASSFEAQQVIYHYDSDLSASLNYSEFLNLFISDRNSYLKSSIMSSSKSFSSVPYDIELSVLRVLEKELDLVKSLCAGIKDINLRYDFNVIDAYRALDSMALDNINTESVRKFLIRNFVTPSEQDVLNIVKRLDIDRDYRVTYTEFKNLFTSYSAGYTSSPSTLLSTSYYSPTRKTFYSPLRTKLYCSPRRCYSPLRSYYSPLKSSTTYYSPIKNSPTVKFSSTCGFNKTNSPIKTLTNEVLSRSPKRVDSPLRNTGNSYNNNLSSTGFSSTSRDNHRYSSYEEEVFLDYIRQLLSVENNLESVKNEISLKSDFNMEDVFSIFEKYEKNYISEFDLKEGFNRYLGIFPLLDDIALLYKRYDTEKNGALR